MQEKKDSQCFLKIESCKFVKRENPRKEYVTVLVEKNIGSLGDSNNLMNFKKQSEKVRYNLYLQIFSNMISLHNNQIYCK